QGANLGLNLAYVLLGRAPSSLESAGINVIGSAVFAKFSRDDENEADQVAIPLMISARIHPNGLVTMFERLIRLRRSSPSALQQWFSTHPTTGDRIDATRAAIRSVPASRLRNLTSDTREFQRIRSRLRSMPAAPRT
ncbi:MAG: M48 family metalloprotease, partial [Gemmatimonadota bacterium]